MRFRNLLGTLTVALLLGMVMFSSPVSAQSLTALSLERTISLNNVLTTLTPNVPANLLASIAGGALEIREQTLLNTQQNTLTSTVFVVPPGSPTPTDLSQIPGASILGVSAITITDTLFTSKPSPALQIVGTISQSTNNPYGNYLGGIGTYSLGYTSDKPPKVNTVIESIAGTAVVYSPSATGTLTVTTPGGGSSGGGSTGVSVVVNGSSSATPTFQTATTQIILDASKSTSTNAGALTYSWTLTQGTASISFPNGNTSIANVQLGSGKINYVIVLKVTDATGASSTTTITIQYL